MKTVEAIIETNGEVHLIHLIEPLQVTTPRRALVTILEEAPTVHDAAGTCPLEAGAPQNTRFLAGVFIPNTGIVTADFADKQKLGVETGRNAQHCSARVRGIRAISINL